MLNRLAAYLLESNPKLMQALRTTYTHVFLDEFQDTTVSQYDLVRATFLGSDSVLTAVGDSKQRIMVWAGAMTEVFDTYRTDFGPVSHELVRNYRSAPELVQMQQVIAMALEADAPQAQAAKVDASGSCSILEFRNPEAEAEYVAELIASGLRDEDMKPRDFCIIVRQRPGEMVETLKKALSKRDIRLRDESQLQDLLIEPVVHFLLAVLRLSTRNRDAEAWDILTSTISMLLGLDENADTAQIEKRCAALVQHARETLTSGHYVEGLPIRLIEMVGEAHFRAAYGQYRRGAFLKSTIQNFADELQVSMGAFTSAREAVDDLVGVDVVPAMTIHKSKGLEFHTVIFLGLEDSQWWSFVNQPDEEKRGFFVAFSRAIEQVYFTFSDVRDERWGRRQQLNTSINELYEILRRAGVPTVDCR
jgi:superfamily I DNA/RNA helicase